VTLLGQFAASLDWAVIAVIDSSTTDGPPPWTSRADQVTVGPTGLAVKVQHAVDGETEVFAWDDDRQAEGVLVSSAEVDIPSGILFICDASHKHVIRLPWVSRRAVVHVYLTEPRYSRRVDFVILKVPRHLGIVA
jgi:hypothetical protein